MSSDTAVIPTTDLQLYFHEAVHDVAGRQRFKPPVEVLIYVSNLLTAFARTEEIGDRLFIKHGRYRSLVDQLNEATDSSGVDKAEKYKRTADAATFVGGFLYKSFARRLVDVDYYTGVAQHAYNNAAAVYSQVSGPHRALAPTLEAVAENLPQVVDVLHEIGTNPNSPKDMLRAYEIFLKTNSKWAARMLLENGIQPVQSARVDNKPQGIILN